MKSGNQPGHAGQHFKSFSFLLQGHHMSSYQLTGVEFCSVESTLTVHAIP